VKGLKPKALSRQMDREHFYNKWCCRGTATGGSLEAGGPYTPDHLSKQFPLDRRARTMFWRLVERDIGEWVRRTWPGSSSTSAFTGPRAREGSAVDFHDVLVELQERWIGRDRVCECRRTVESQ
jgi:hypothetical protein